MHPLWETWADLVHPDAQDILDTLEDNRDTLLGIGVRVGDSICFLSIPSLFLPPSSILALSTVCLFFFLYLSEVRNELTTGIEWL